MQAIFAVPGRLSTPTGGYAYARRVLAGAKAGGLDLVHWPLPDGFPAPSGAALAETGRRLALAPAGWPLLIDGLALGAMPSEIIASAPGPVVALCHHPLALETGIEPAARERLAASEREALGLAAAVITTSRTTAETLSTHFGVAPGKIAIALPGTDPAPRARGSGSGTVALLSVGSLVPRKGHDVLLSALGRLKALDWRLEIVGADDRDRRHADALKAQAVSLGISDRVTFTGAASEADLEQRYARADVFVLASHYEGFGMVYAEAIARGLPVIGTRAGAIAEATGGAAELVTPGDVDALASTLARVLASPSARHDLASRAEAAARTLPRWTDTVAAIVTALERVAVSGSERRCCGASR